jgi:large subunit ribosomal protein L24
MDQTQGGIIEKESSIHRSNVMLFCEKCDKPVRYGVRTMEDNSKVRYCKKCEELFDK